jgi:DNA-binding NarL/FixJ family response regulator
MMPITIILADDHHVVREGLRTLLESQPDFRVIGETGDGLQVVSLVDKLRPQVLVLDLMLPGLDGLEISRQVHKNLPQTNIVILSMHANEAYVVEALAAGATAYLLKQATSDELVEAIRAAIVGQRYLSTPLSEHLLDTYRHKLATEESDDPYHTLTLREREVLHLSAEGLTNKEVAARLVLSARTTEKYRSSLMQKLDLKNQTELVHYALQRGLISLE